MVIEREQHQKRIGQANQNRWLTQGGEREQLTGTVRKLTILHAIWQDHRDVFPRQLALMLVQNNRCIHGDGLTA